MNKKGFTMIELLAVIAVLGLVLIITFPNISGIFKGSKLKAEEAFIDRLSQSIDSYVTLNSSNLSFEKQTGSKFTKSLNSTSQEVEVYKANIKVKDIINDGIITEKDYKNPTDETKTCNIEAEIEVYQDSDQVFCHKIKISSLEDCLSSEYIEKNKIDSDYIVNTCVWNMEER